MLWNSSIKKKFWVLTLYQNTKRMPKVKTQWQDLIKPQSNGITFFECLERSGNYQRCKSKG